MKLPKTSSRAILVLLTTVVAASGCIQSSSTDLNPDFDLEHSEVDVNSSGMEIYQASVAESNFSGYSVDSDNRMAMNLPVFSVAVNLTSEGLFENDSYDVNSSGTMRFGFGQNSNSTEFQTQISSDGSSSEIVKQVGSRENSTENKYSRQDLGLTMEAFKEIKVEDASVLGVSNISGEENLLLNLTFNESDLMRNSEKIFEAHSPVQESTDQGEDMSDAASFKESEAYLWVDREDQSISRFAYYGSAQDGSLQVRSVTEYSER